LRNAEALGQIAGARHHQLRSEYEHGDSTSSHAQRNRQRQHDLVRLDAGRLGSRDPHRPDHEGDQAHQEHDPVDSTE
jgi:hypothetical protein